MPARKKGEKNIRRLSLSQIIRIGGQTFDLRKPGSQTALEELIFSKIYEYLVGLACTQEKKSRLELEMYEQQITKMVSLCSRAIDRHKISPVAVLLALLIIQESTLAKIIHQMVEKGYASVEILN